MPSMMFPGMEGFPPPPRDTRSSERGGIGGGYAANMPPEATQPREPLFSSPIDSAGNRSPTLPCASPIAGDLLCPLGDSASPHLTTPHLLGAASSGAWPPPPDQSNFGAIGGLSQIDAWAWEMGSDVGSVPSAWSKATSTRTGKSSASRMSSANGLEGLIPGLVDGQRLSAIKPSTVPARGGKVIVSLRKEVPQGYWDVVSFVLVKGTTLVTLKPTGIKKGKKLCIEVPPLSPDDYDVRLKFGEKIIHGSIPLAVCENGEENSDMDVDLREVAEHFKGLAP